MDDRMRWILGVGVVATTFVFFFLYVYKPKAADAIGTTKVEDSLRPSARFYEQPIRFVPEFKFQTHRGDSLSSKQLKNKIFVTDFFFTTCEAACPGMSTQMSRVQNAFKNEKEFNIISFSIDPKKDKLEILQAYASKFGAVEDSWFFLRGPQEEIFQLGQDGFMQSLVNDNGELDHSEKFVLVDSKGGIRGFYQGTKSKEVDKLINDVKYLLKQNEESL
ncbi:MAG: protein SCO1/2 [Limisphaerales bacterium]|jgi:protein SCO1/2